MSSQPQGMPDESRVVPVRRPPWRLGSLAEPTSPVGLRLVYHCIDPTPPGRTTSMVEAQMDGPSGIFIQPEVIRQINSAILTAIGPDFRLFDGHLEVLDPRDHLTDGSSIPLFERNQIGGTWRMAELPAHPQDMASGWNYLAQIVVRSCFSDPNGPRRTRSILLPLEDLDLSVPSIRKMLLEAGLLSLDPGAILEGIRLMVRREEVSQVAPWGTTDIRRLDLDGLPPVWVKTTEGVSPASQAALEVLRGNLVLRTDELDDDKPGEAILLPDDHEGARVL